MRLAAEAVQDVPRPVRDDAVRAELQDEVDVAGRVDGPDVELVALLVDAPCERGMGTQQPDARPGDGHPGREATGTQPGRQELHELDDGQVRGEGTDPAYGTEREGHHRH